MRILLVEDHDDSRETLRRLLRHEGHEVFAFASAAPASRAFDALRPEVALLDVALPGGRSGDDLAREIAGRLPETNIIFVTWAWDVAKLETAVPSCRVMRKAIDVDALARMLE